ncbi:MAG: tRNA (adenosine(37)-N6)-threonylcarbamoyltransferase complex ATPase subunit type 1 TsaE [Gemmatimonadaceae bacterium]|nr:tRNA (adenosine(37)-N6)-threonylcarbamoyltransferase complex ATPase subunit type 1 TsaE [Gemmatimonadaceae bacterium]
MQAQRPVVPPLAERGRLTLNEPELRSWGESLGRSAAPPLLISLSGELGAGKTTLAQAICRGYEVVDEVTSPTYALVHRYEAKKSPVFHVDLYRLSGGADLTNIGWDDILAEQALVIVEWPERAGSALPSGHLHVDLEYAAGDASRRVVLAG